ncbi:MAG: ABC transporter ATP-binding protein [Syntrophales bacterium LBB04]|nr:ABC transporter ATP-binding protein [Syntrophales bacterium LBB04]
MLVVRDMNSYYGKIRALKNVSIGVPQGALVSIVGANGAGKTTLLSSIYGLLPYISGTVRFKDSDVTHAATELLVSRGMALVPERRELFSDLSVQDNLLLGAYKYVVRREKEKTQGIFDFSYALFPILKTRQNQKAGTLSGGEQQMLAIARALMSSPEALLLDEPSLGLAPIIVNGIFQTIVKLNREGVTILLVEQNAMQALKVASYGYVLQTGEVAKEGSSFDLLNNEEIRDMYLGESISAPPGDGGFASTNAISNGGPK